MTFSREEAFFDLERGDEERTGMEFVPGSFAGAR